MATTTVHYKLQKPALNDFAGPEAFNANADIIDAALAAHDQALITWERLLQTAGNTWAASETTAGGLSKWVTSIKDATKKVVATRTEQETTTGWTDTITIGTTATKMVLTETATGWEGVVSIGV